MEDYIIETPDKKFQDDFNSGYILAEHDPDMLEKILWELEINNDARAVGLKYGKWQYEFDIEEKHLHKMSLLRQKGKDLDKGRNR